MVRIRVVAVVAVLAGLLAACGSSSSAPASSGSSSTPAAGGHTVTISDFKYTPATLSVKAGTKVTFVNQGGTIHNATTQGNSTINTGNLNGGQSMTVTLTKPGTYNYICTLHPFMKGTVIVH
jgi:plastocyanin